MASEIVMEDREKNPTTETSNRSFRIAQSILRVVVIFSTAVALGILVTSEQQVVVFGIVFKAKYSYSPAFMFLAAADGVVCGFSALSLTAACLLGSGLKPRSYFVLFLLDLVMAMLMISACSAAFREGYIGKYGSDHTGWMAICERVPKFCNKVTVSTALSSLSFVTCFVLTIISAHAAMSASARKN